MKQGKTWRGFQNLLGLPVAYEVSVGAVIVRREPDVAPGKLGEWRYLLLRYPHGHWDFVKGHVEPGETHKETLQRETLEESGISELNIMPGFHQKIRYFYTAKGTEREKRRRQKRGLWIFKTVHYYLAQTGTIEVILSNEHIDFAWLPFHDAVERASFSSAKSMLERAQAFLERR